ncbi:GH12 family glycosyl hydrolase domain-containing protein [Acidithiobacillus caldus]
MTVTTRFRQSALWVAVGIGLTACGSSGSSPPSSRPSHGHLPEISQERCFSHQNHYGFETALGRGNIDVWRPLGPWKLCGQSTGNQFSVRWKFSPSAQVQAYPHIVLFPKNLPIDWQKQSLPQETWILRDNCTPPCRDDMGWDLWISNQRNATPFVAGNGEEVMVLPVYRLPTPPGQTNNLVVSGAGWQVYRFRVNGWPIVQVIFPGNVHRVSLSITDALRKLADNGEIPPSDRFLIAANIGTEIVQGKGSSTLASGE